MTIRKYNIPVGSSPTKIHGTGPSPRVKLKVNKIRVTKAAHSHSMWMDTPRAPMVSPQAERLTRRRVFLPKTLIRPMPKLLPNTWTTPMMMVA